MLNDEPITVLDQNEAWKFLQSRTMGRLAVSVGFRPDIFPVNYHADGGSILFRTAPGSKLLEVTINEAVAFETDRYDTNEAWSVVVKGRERSRHAGRDLRRTVPSAALLGSDPQACLRSHPSDRGEREALPFGPEPDTSLY